VNRPRVQVVGFPAFRDAVACLVDRGIALGHQPTVAWGQSAWDNMLHAEERHTFKCRHCSGRATVRRFPSCHWRVEAGSLLESTCLAPRRPC
jgi:hypothetical protein